MKKPLELENFSGPLDLLLQLIEEEQLNITEVSLAQVTEQFLTYLEEVEERLPEELADFLVVATKLLLIKSRTFLPLLEVDDEEDPGQLAAQLRMYKRYAEATHDIENRIAQKLFLYSKKEVKEKNREVIFRPPTEMTSETLRELFVESLSRLEPVVRIPKAAIEKVVTLREKIAQIQRIIHNAVTVGFEELLADTNDRGEVVVTFLALLELVKQKNISVKQERSFTKITIEQYREE